jgi:hypothetical protein
MHHVEAEYCLRTKQGNIFKSLFLIDKINTNQEISTAQTFP